jgi:hypothetical protein
VAAARAGGIGASVGAVFRCANNEAQTLHFRLSFFIAQAGMYVVFWTPREPCRET